MFCADISGKTQTSSGALGVTRSILNNLQAHYPVSRRTVSLEHADNLTGTLGRCRSGGDAVARFHLCNTNVAIHRVGGLVQFIRTDVRSAPSRETRYSSTPTCPITNSSPMTNCWTCMGGISRQVSPNMSLSKLTQVSGSTQTSIYRYWQNFAWRGELPIFDDGKKPVVRLD